MTRSPAVPVSSPTDLADSPPSLSPVQGASRRILFRTLARIGRGTLTIRDAAQTGVFGVAGRPGDPHVTVSIRRPAAYAAIVLGGSLGAGESYMDGDWDCDDVTGLIRLLLINREALEQLDRRWLAWARPAQRLAYWLQRNSRSGSRRNISAHYDLSNELFQTFLDPTMTYSAAIFDNGAASLQDASIEKLDRCCRKLDLQPTDHLLEIGTGWGSMAIHAAINYGCRVTTTTISRNQASLARQRVEAAGLSDRITVVEQDYRTLDGTFDKIVSIEMIEAVGARYLDAYFAQCMRLLKPEGLMALQAITIRDQYWRNAARTRDWLKKYIFPGSCLLSNAAIQRSVSRATDMRLLHLEDIGPHYATTLEHWRTAFNRNLDRVRSLGFDDRFIRMWNYYLCYCRGAFLERHCSAVQILLARPDNRRTPLESSGHTHV